MQTTEPMDMHVENVIRIVAGSTMSYSDRIHNAMLIRGARPEHRAQVIRIIAKQRREWLNWLTMTQRRWQKETRRPSRARHHDSIAIREKYVRCSSG